jgi:hypothetical protein
VYAQNNPVLYMDINGEGVENDYKLNKKTGEIKLVRRTEDKFDRLLETDDNGNIQKYGVGFLIPESKRGKEKVAIDNISEGILKDGLNLQENSVRFEVNGENKPTLEEFNRFISEFTDYKDKEIAGIQLARENSDKIERVRIFRYGGDNDIPRNTNIHSHTPENWFITKLKFLRAHFHTHPGSNHVPSDDDWKIKDNNRNIKYYIISDGYAKEY